MTCKVVLYRKPAAEVLGGVVPEVGSVVEIAL
jgi:hypothetical protein